MAASKPELDHGVDGPARMASSSRVSSWRPRLATRLHRPGPLLVFGCGPLTEDELARVSCTAMRSAAPAVASIMPRRRTRVAVPMPPSEAPRVAT